MLTNYQTRVTCLCDWVASTFDSDVLGGVCVWPELTGGDDGLVQLAGSVV